MHRKRDRKEGQVPGVEQLGGIQDGAARGDSAGDQDIAAVQEDRRVELARNGQPRLDETEDTDCGIQSLHAAVRAAADHRDPAVEKKGRGVAGARMVEAGPAENTPVSGS